MYLALLSRTNYQLQPISDVFIPIGKDLPQRTPLYRTVEYSHNPTTSNAYVVAGEQDFYGNRPAGSNYTTVGSTSMLFNFDIMQLVNRCLSIYVDLSVLLTTGLAFQNIMQSTSNFMNNEMYRSMYDCNIIIGGCRRDIFDELLNYLSKLMDSARLFAGSAFAATTGFIGK
ncbi:hypothetical protein DICVIV_09163 [Dictyocaulus viviparus]|uniref:Uncharacterized protein n=1 Tax=Dictyocaulus viviparus TaxID=29172 RepID=A0A0D8XR32_DICVI|nr:hypothetical protein DICVIV_09163 [Dictyocaulus viviparus]